MAGPLGNTGFATSAALEALLKNKPKNEGLASLHRQAEEKFQQEVQAGKAQGHLGKIEAERALPKVQETYAQAEKQGQAARAVIAPGLAALPANNPLRIAAESERALGSERLGGERARAVSSVEGKKLAAGQLPAYTQASAAALLTKELRALGEKQSALSGTERAEAVSDSLKQEREQRKESAAERRALRSDSTAKEGHSITKADAEATRAQKKYEHEHPSAKAGSGETVGGVKQLPQKEQNRAASEVARIKELAETGLAAHQTRAQIREHLVKGKPSVTVEGVKTSGMKPLQPSVLMEAALDWAEYKALQPQTVVKLHQHGYSVKAIGAPVAQTPKTAKGIGQNIQKGIEGLA